MLFLLIGRTDMDRRTFTKSEGSEITWAVKDRRNNNPREISHLIVKPCAIGAVPFLVTKSVPDTRSGSMGFQSGPRAPVFA
jgi:hypothetical protein